MSTFNLLLALTLGFLPALFWLWFWLREDKEKPEPISMIALAFVAGMAVVPLVLPLQKLALDYFSHNSLIFVWVVVEETLKYAIALSIILWNKEVDEPIDYIIYMISIALGFSALENALFVFTPIQNGDFVGSLMTGNFRFLGASLLHVLASGTIGVFMALTYYKHAFTKLLASTFGLFIAVLLHTLFNFFIMDASGETILMVFFAVWGGITVLFVLFEEVKIIARRHTR